MENSLVVLHLNFHEVSITHKNIVNDMKWKFNTLKLLHKKSTVKISHEIITN
jgi:hypothetical protein